MGALSFLCIAMTAMAAAPAMAQGGGEQPQSASTRVQQFDIPAGSLAGALNALARQAGLTLSVDPSLVAGKKAPALTGAYTPQQALQQVLAGSGLGYRLTETGTVTLFSLPEPKDTVALSPVTVTASAEQGAPSFGAKLLGAPREVPQSVTVVDQERIEQQNLQTMGEALEQVQGVTVERIDANRFNVYSRGFEVNRVLMNGVSTRLDDRLFLAPNLAMYERVEVLKGPGGLLSGTGTPGGVVNLVRKRPQANNAVVGEAGIGSWNNYLANVDVTGPLNADGTLRGRAVAAVQDREFFYDRATEQNALLYGVLEKDLTPATLLRVGAAYQTLDARGTPWTLPGYNDGTLLDVPRSTALGADWNRGDYDSLQLFGELEHYLDNGWAANAALLFLDGEIDRREAYAFGAVDPADNLTTLYSYGFRDEQRQASLDVNMTGPFQLFGREHRLLLGATYEKTDFKQTDTVGDTGLPFGQVGQIDVFNPPSSILQPAFIDDGGKTEKTDEYGVYGNIRVSVSDPLTLLAGGRLSWWEHRFQPFGGTEQRDDFSGEFTPFAGFIYDLNKSTSVYASYAEIFQPQDARDADDNLLKPLRGRQYEVA
jgi:outer membrane receptor for ferric coprogen and ferric-rhodotorulic acid